MTTPTDSKFFFNDCSCLKKEVTSEVFIQCNACIEGFGRECSCKYRTVRQLNCPRCSADRDRLDNMHIVFDNLLLDLSSTVKSYTSCDNNVRAIIKISKQMQQCNNRLLSRINTTDMDGYEYDIHDENIDDTSSETSNGSVF